MDLYNIGFLHRVFTETKNKVEKYLVHIRISLRFHMQAFWLFQAFMFNLTITQNKQIQTTAPKNGGFQ